MSKGIAVPVGVNGQGGTQTVDGDAQIFQLIQLVLSDNDTDNAFQQGLGLGSDVVFQSGSASFRARILNRLFELFDQFDEAELFRLQKETISFVPNKDKPEEQILSFKFINLESDEVIPFSKTFT